MLKKSTYKAEKLIELLQSYGTGFARSHVNIEPTSKLDSLKNLEIALANKKDSFGAEFGCFSSTWFILHRFDAVYERSC